jgi:hypothetical protein
LPPLLVDPTAEESAIACWTEAQRAASWAFGYRVEHITTDGRRRVVLGPHHSTSFGVQTPPPIESAPAEVLDAWEALSEVVTTPYATARLEHVLFAAKHGNGFARAIAAAEAYLRCADGWSREYDAVGDLQTELALSRAVGNHSLRQRIIDLVLDRAQAALTPPTGGQERSWETWSCSKTSAKCRTGTMPC